MYNALTTHNSYPFLDIRSNAGSIYRSITQPCAQVRPLDNDKEMTETDALSLIILELNYSRPFDPDTESVQVMRVENSNSYLYVSSLSKFRYHIISSEPVIGL